VPLLVIILSSSSLRGRLRNQMVVSLAVANVLVATYSAPLDVDFVINMKWRHGCLVELTRDLLTVYIQNFVTQWGVLFMLLHYEARVRDLGVPSSVTLRLHHVLLRVAAVLYVLLPWIVGVVVLVPVVFTGLLYRIWKYLAFERCPLITSNTANIVYNVVTSYIPSLFTIIVVAVIALSVRNGRAQWLPKDDSDKKESSGGDNDPRRVESGNAGLVSWDSDLQPDPALVHVLVGVATVLCYLPMHLSKVIRRHYSPRDYYAEINAYVALQIVEDALPVLMGAAWLLMLPDVVERRRELGCVLRERLSNARWMLSCCRSRPPNTTDCGIAPVTFRDLHDE
jgi:hypothetical protein